MRVLREFLLVYLSVEGARCGLRAESEHACGLPARNPPLHFVVLDRACCAVCQAFLNPLSSLQGGTVYDAVTPSCRA